MTRIISPRLRQTSDIKTLAARDEDQRELINLVYAVSPESSPKHFIQQRMTLVAGEDCVINPSFPIEVHFTFHGQLKSGGIIFD